jgi:sugar phosphate isomerase/epimerase
MSNSQSDIRIGTIVHFCDDVYSYIRQILPEGFESFQLSFPPMAEGFDFADGARRVAAELQGSGAIVSSLFHGGNPMGDRPGDIASLRTLEALIDNAHHFGTDLVCAFTGRVRGVPIPDSIPRYREVWGELARRASDRGVRLAFENCSMGGNWASGDWNIAHSPAAWELMFNALDADNIGLEWEPCHQMLLLMDPMAQLRHWHHKFFHIHGKDASVYWDVVREYGIESNRPWVFHRTPGFGDSDWTAIISELRRFGFKGCIDIEGWHDPVYVGEREMTGQVHALRHLKRCRGGEYVPNPRPGP